MGAKVNTDKVRSVVESIWGKLVPDCDFDESLTWSDAGIDSLKALKFVLQLEEQLGHAISFDLFTNQSTIGDLIQGLAVQGAPAANSAAANIPTFFLFPGVLGDEPILAEFRASLKGRIRFHTLTLPDIHEPLAVTTSMRAMADRAVDEIMAHSPEGPIHLAGYSFGGYLAFETARAITDRGHKLGLLVLLDAMTGAVEPDADGETPLYSNGLRARITDFVKLFDEGVPAFFDRFNLRVAMRQGALDTALKIALKPPTPKTANGSFKRRRALLLHLRMRAMRDWKPQRLATPVLLTTSDQYVESSDPEIWGSLCTDLTIDHVGGGHRSIFEPGPVALVNEALFRALVRYDSGASKSRSAPKRTKVAA